MFLILAFKAALNAALKIDFKINPWKRSLQKEKIKGARVITIERYTPEDETALLEISLSEEQEKYTASPRAFLFEEQGSADRFVVGYEGNIIGYFKIYRHFSNQLQPCETNAIGLRKFAIDQRQQGKGLGTATVKELATVLPIPKQPEDARFQRPSECSIRGKFL
ncbi:GNAT family N-acetyltransferase [Enterovibrio calviensis]|uniref:GNAT family N-acetyltransferase n=1 Tax=Enterovibrio calviensis TaxID=91359 RepID=UPI000485047A|nr:GNAT family N-acetyltransferase [Enterovibrio calviensis]